MPNLGTPATGSICMLKSLDKGALCTRLDPGRGLDNKLEATSSSQGVKTLLTTNSLLGEESSQRLSGRRASAVRADSQSLPFGLRIGLSARRPCDDQRRRALRRPLGDLSAGHARPGHEHAGRHRDRLRHLAGTAGHHPGRAAAGHPRPGVSGPARPGCRGRVPRHPRHPRRQLAAVLAGAEADTHPACLPRR